MRTLDLDNEIRDARNLNAEVEQLNRKNQVLENQLSKAQEKGERKWPERTIMRLPPEVALLLCLILGIGLGVGLVKQFFHSTSNPFIIVLSPGSPRGMNPINTEMFLEVYQTGDNQRAPQPVARAILVRQTGVQVSKIDDPYVFGNASETETVDLSSPKGERIIERLKIPRQFLRMPTSDPSETTPSNHQVKLVFSNPDGKKLIVKINGKEAQAPYLVNSDQTKVEIEVSLEDQDKDQKVKLDVNVQDSTGQPLNAIVKINQKEVPGTYTVSPNETELNIEVHVKKETPPSLEYGIAVLIVPQEWTTLELDYDRSGTWVDPNKLGDLDSLTEIQTQSEDYKVLWLRIHRSQTDLLNLHKDFWSELAELERLQADETTQNFLKKIDRD